MTRADPRPVLALLAVQAMFGVHYLASKIVLAQIPPRAWVVLRAGSAAVLLLAVTAGLGVRWPRAARDYLRLAAFSVFGVIINQLCFIEGIHRTTATHASILITGIPVGTLLFGVALGREALSGRKLAALALSTTGVLLVVGLPRGSDGGPEPSLTGDLLVLINGLSYAFFLVISKRTLERVSPVAATAVLMGIGFLGLALIGGRDVLRFDYSAPSASVWAWAAFIAAFPTALGYLLNYWALKRVDASLVGLFIYLQPVIATALAAAFLGERPGPTALAGAAAIFAGVHLASTGGDVFRKAD